MLVVRVTENVLAVQSSYYSSCPCIMSQCDTGHGCHTCDIHHICLNYHCHVSLVT
jgi:hypothetical protein